jgi:hypothetical protein
MLHHIAAKVIGATPCWASHCEKRIQTVANEGFHANGSFDSALRRKVSMTVEVLFNLAYLTKFSAEDPAEVRRYVGLAEDRLADLVDFLGGSKTTTPGR